MEPNSPSNPKSSDAVDAKVIVGVLWVISLVAVGILGYFLGTGNTPTEIKSDKEVLSSLSNQITPAPTQQVETTPAQTTNSTCEVTGYAQKWEYLISYIVKEKDSIQGIAETELGDANRVNEILKLNGVGPLVVGSTLYLPPKSITKSSGNIKQVSGKLMEKNASMWHLSFNEDEKGMGILIPTYWFKAVPDTDFYRVGDCLTILLDDGNTVYTVEKQ